MRQPFVGLVLAAIIGIVVADYFPAISRPILFIAILGALAGLRWSYGPLVFALVGTTFFALHSARITSTPADALAEIAGGLARPASVTGIVTRKLPARTLKRTPRFSFTGAAGQTWAMKWHFLALSNQSSRREIPANSICAPTSRAAM